MKGKNLKKIITIFLASMIFSCLSSFICYCDAGHTPDTCPMTNFSTRNLPTGQEQHTCNVCGKTWIGNGGGGGVSDRKSKEEILEENKFLVQMFYDVLGIESAGGDVADLLNTQQMMQNFNNIVLTNLSSFKGTGIYNAFLGVGIFLLIIQYIMDFYSNRMNRDDKTIEQYTKIILQFMLGVFIICNAMNLALILLNVMAGLMNTAWGFHNSSAVSGVSQGTADEIIYDIFVANGLDKKSVVEKALNINLNMMLLTLKMFIPWLISLVGKFGLLFATAKANINIFVNAMFMPLASYDCTDNLKSSNFLKYLKKVASSGIELIVIVLVINASATIQLDFLNDATNNLNSNNWFSCIIILVVMQLVRFVSATSLAGTIAMGVMG